MVQFSAIIKIAQTLFSSLSSKAWLVLGACIVATLGWWYVSSLKSTINTQIQTIATMRATNEVLKDQNATLRVSYDTIKLSLDAQNDFVQRLGINLEFLSKDMTILTSNIENKFGVLSKDLKKFAATDMSSLTCDQAIEELRKHAQGNK